VAELAGVLKDVLKELRDSRESPDHEPEGGTASSTGVKGIERFEREKKAYRAHPDVTTQKVTKRVEQVLGPGRSLQEYVNQGSSLNGNRLFMMLGQLILGVIASLETDQPEHAMARCIKILTFLDQVGLNGELEFGYRMTLEDDPPGLLRAPKNLPKYPSASTVQATSTGAFCQLAMGEPEHIAGALGMLKNMHDLATLRAILEGQASQGKGASK